MSKSHKNKHLGDKNSQFGTCYITKDNINKKIKKEELNNYLYIGWVQGRYIKTKTDYKFYVYDLDNNLISEETNCT